MIKQTSIAGVLLLATSSVFLGANPKLSPDLQNLGPRANVKVIVQYASGPTLLGGVFNLVDSILLPVGEITGLGGTISMVSDLLNVIACDIPAASLETLAASPNITYITPDRTLAARLDYTAAAVNAGSAWKANLNGAGVGVAIIDSGVTPSPDLALLGVASRIVYSADFTGGNGSDQYGHGTHVAGIVGANGISSHCVGCTRSLMGMAPNSSIINLRVLDANGQGTDSALIQALGEAVRLKSTYNIRVINLSLGRPAYESYTLDPVCQAVEAAWKAGIVVVSAAGNDGRDNSVGNSGYGTIESPGNDPYVITVGAMKAMDTYSRTDDLVASYSSKGPTAVDHLVKPDIMAPGNLVVSLQAPGSTLATETANQVPVSYYQAGGSSAASTKFLMLNGTSMATPVVSGVVADLLQAHPTLTPDQVKARLMKTAYKTFPKTSTAVDSTTGQSFVSQYDMFTIGAGYLDAAAALANTELANGTAMSPTAYYDSTSGNVYMKFDPSSTWTNSGKAASVWGSQVVWGNAVVNTSGALWGEGAVWGTSSLTAFKTMWSTSGIWGSKTMWSTSSPDANKTMWGTDASVSDSNTQFAVNQP